MDQQRWRQIERIYNSAMELDLGERRGFLAEACASDESLRLEIESLLAHHTSHKCLLDEPVLESMADSAATLTSESTGSVRQAPLAPGTLLNGRFRIIRAAGAGGMGYVYEAKDEKLTQRIALKCAKPGYKERLPPEVRAAREVSHFNVCKVHDLHVASTPQGEMEFLSMEFIEGETLSARLEREGPLPEHEAREIARQICSGVAQAHRQGVIHGDLKPGNIIVVRDPRTRVLRAVVTDFGMATMNPIEGASVPAVHGGTLDFMAPELFLGEKSTVASDVYALGILFHLMLKGEAPKRMGSPVFNTRAVPPRAGSQAETITAGPAIIEADWQRPVSALPAPWHGVITQCIAPLAKDRYRSVDEVARSLQPHRLLLKTGIAAAAVALLALGIWQWSPAPVGPPVRLAILPFSIEGDPVADADGIAIDVASRLSGGRPNFTVISPLEARRSDVKTGLHAKGALGATHLLETRLNRSGATITATAALTDLASGHTLGRTLNGTYATDDSAGLAKAILATVTGALELRGRSPKESVSNAAYPAYLQGMNLLPYDPGKAIPYFEKAIALDPRSALPYARLADAQMKKFDNREGPKWLEMAGANVARAEAINPDSVPVLLVSGTFQEDHGSYEPALRAFTRATELEPGNADVWKRLAEAYDKANRSGDAIATYQQAMKAQPDNYQNYLSFGNFYWYRSEFQRAEELYRRVTAIVPELAMGHMDLGLALMEQGRYPEAEQSLLRARELQANSPLVLMNLAGLYYAEERYQDAAPIFQQSVVSGEPSAVRYKDLGDVHRHLGNQAKAAEAYRLAKSMAQDEVIGNPRLADSRVLLALALAHLGEADSARFEAAQALSMEPENAIVMHEAVMVYEALKQREESLHVLQQAPGWLLSELSRHPDSKDLRQDPRFQELLRSQSARSVERIK